MLENVKDVLNSKAPLIIEALQEPATREQLSKLEDAIKQKLPKGLIQLYSEHNGINPSAYANFVYGIPFIPIESSIAIMERYEKSGEKYSLRFADQGINKDYFLGKKRVPIGDANGDCILCVDLEPDTAGIFAQIIIIDTEKQVAIKLNESLEQCIDLFEKDLTANRYKLQEDALDDGVHWLEPEQELDPVNWFHSSRWKYIKF